MPTEAFEVKPTALRGGNGISIYHNGRIVAELHEDPEDRGKAFVFVFGPENNATTRRVICRNYTDLPDKSGHVHL